MAKDWEYAKVTKWIAEHGGPEKALETVKNYYMKKGAASQKPVTVLAGIVGLVVGIASKCVYDGIKERKSLEIGSKVAEQDKVKEAENELVRAMKEDSKTETEAANEVETD